MQPVYDRMQADIDNKTAKAYFNPTDFNRIEQNCEYLAGIFGVTIVVKTWTRTDFPTLSDMTRIRNNIATLRTAYYTYSTTPPTPSVPLNEYHKANYIEQILNDLMAFSLKVWVDRISEFPNRRKLDATGITDTYDVTRSEGIVSVEGDKFNALEMNDLEDRTKKAIDAVETIADAAVPNTRKVNGKALSADVVLTPTDLGLGNVNNTADSQKSVNYANTAGSAPANGGTANAARYSTGDVALTTAALRNELVLTAAPTSFLGVGVSADVIS